MDLAYDLIDLQNDELSYILTILPGGLPGQLYCGKRLRERESFEHLRTRIMPFSAALTVVSDIVPEENVRLKFPPYGSSDYRQGAISILQENGSRVLALEYESYRIMPGKPKLDALPATYTEEPGEASTLVLTLRDSVTDVRCELYYTVFSEGGILTRSVRFMNEGMQTLYLERVMSLCLDLPDDAYEWISLDGAWGRERIPHAALLTTGIQGIESIRGNSSHQHNPFLALKRVHTTENSGQAMGFSLVYSGNFLAQVQVDQNDFSRVLMGINPTWFSWELLPGESFQSPEAVMVYSDRGLNGMSQCFHRLYRTRLVRGAWRDRPRPILINNWEATHFDISEEQILQIAEKARECGIEMFVLDFSRPEVVDHIHEMISGILRESEICYIKWDMNRSITECYSVALPPHRQGEVFHRCILGVYSLYERLISEFPDILFESCASGGGRFDPGMLYYAPQTWTSDDTDAYERLKIQYGTSLVYPISAIGSHVSAVPNFQTGRSVSLRFRADVAYFGTYGYELDLNTLTPEEQEDVVRFTAFMKAHRELIQFGDFYRLSSPFEGNDAGWMVVNKNRSEAIVGWYHALHQVNRPGKHLKLAGLKPDACYTVRIPADKPIAAACPIREIGSFFGDELMNIGLISHPNQSAIESFIQPAGDFSSEIFLLSET